MLEWSIFIAKELQIYVYPYAYVQRESERAHISKEVIALFSLEGLQKVISSTLKLGLTPN